MTVCACYLCRRVVVYPMHVATVCGFQVFGCCMYVRYAKNGVFLHTHPNVLLNLFQYTWSHFVAIKSYLGQD